jgi:hypothetical protein
MASHPITLTRKELCDKVWSQPVPHACEDPVRTPATRSSELPLRAGGEQVDNAGPSGRSDASITLVCPSAKKTLAELQPAADCPLRAGAA